MCSRVFTRRLSLLALVAACGWLATCGATPAVADLVWYDGFSLTTDGGDYDPTLPLGGQSGGSNPGAGTDFFTGPWVQAGTDVTNVFTHSKWRSSPIHPVVGGSIGAAENFDCCYFSRTSRMFTEPWSGFTNPDATFWMGFNVNFGSGNPADVHHRAIEFHDGGFDDTLNRNLMLGYSSFAMGSNDMQLAVRDSVTNTTTPVPIPGAPALNGETHFIAMKFEMSNSGNDVISVYLNPIGTTEPAFPDVQVSVGEFLADRMSGLVQFTFTGPDGGGLFDELRVADQFSFSDVANLTVPEPASLSLLGLGAIGLVMAVRRKRA